MRGSLESWQVALGSSLGTLTPEMLPGMVPELIPLGDSGVPGTQRRVLRG